MDKLRKELAVREENHRKKKEREHIEWQQPEHERIEKRLRIRELRQQFKDKQLSEEEYWNLRDEVEGRNENETTN